MNAEAARDWIDSAERDRDAAIILLESPKIPFEIVAFHCQQCAEKYLKSLFVLHGRRPPFIHDLQKLCIDIQDACGAITGIESACERLTPFGTITRYPGSEMQPRPEHMPRVMSWMDTIRESTLSCMEELRP